MTPENVVAVLTLALGIIGAFSALVVQTQRLIQIADSYMVELRKNNALQESQVKALTTAIVGDPPTQILESPDIREPSVGESI